MGWQVGGVCYGTQVAAVQAATSAEVGQVITLGAVAYTVDVTATTSTTATYHLRRISGTPDLIQTVDLTPAPCNLLEGSDGLVLGWSLIGVWVAAYAVKYLSTLVR